MSNSQLILLLIIIVVVYLLWQTKDYPVPPVPSPLPPHQYHKAVKKSFPNERTKRLERELREHWKFIHPSFDISLVENWKLNGHNYLTATKWIECGVKPTEYELVAWISTVKVHEIKPYNNFSGYEFNNPTWVINHYGSIEPLRREWLSQRF